MTNLREAAQMALDALEHGLPIIEDFGGKEQLQIQHKAISALYEALSAALAQPEQEPVAWITTWNEPSDAGVELHWAKQDKGLSSKHTPLYTAAPQREWQGLTENEIKHLWYEACQTNLELTSQLIVHLAKNIEAKIKEKNT